MLHHGGITKLIWDKIAAKLFPDNNKDSKKYTQKFISNVWEICIDIMREAHKEGNWKFLKDVAGYNYVPNTVIIDILQLLLLPDKVFECIDNKLCKEGEDQLPNAIINANINEMPILIAFNYILKTRIYGKLNDGTSFNQYNRVLDVSSDKKFDIMKWVDNKLAVPPKDKSVTITQPSTTTISDTTSDTTDHNGNKYKRTCPKSTIQYNPDCDLKSSLSCPSFRAECAAQGICDRNTGECKCYDDYVGKACERDKVVNDAANLASKRREQKRRERRDRRKKLDITFKKLQQARRKSQKQTKKEQEAVEDLRRELEEIEAS